MTGDRQLESGGALSGGPMSGPSCLGFSGKTHPHQQQYSNMDTSGIRNQIYRNGQGTSHGGSGMYGGVPISGIVNNSALPPMSTS